MMVNLVKKILPSQIRDILRPYAVRYQEQRHKAQGRQAQTATTSLQSVTGSQLGTPDKPRRTNMYEVDPSSEEFQRILNQHWYYSVELKPGLYTRGDEHNNVICTRELLARLSPAGLDICDIGTMEGIIPVLLKRRGARRVVALDAMDHTEKILLVQSCTGQGFDYIPRVSLSRAKDVLSDRARLSNSGLDWAMTNIQRGFDVLILSGILYHTLSPIHVIGLARTLLRQGGLLILETAASCQDGYAQNWVFQGDKWIYPSGSNTWFVTLRLLDHLLRFMKLKPVDCVHGPIGEVVRVAVSAVAVADPLPLHVESEWFLKTAEMPEYAEAVDSGWALGSVDIPFSCGDCVYHPELSGAVDLHMTVKSRPALPHDRNKIILALEHER
jgi:hypothetical protein